MDPGTFKRWRHRHFKIASQQILGSGSVWQRYLRSGTICHLIPFTFFSLYKNAITDVKSVPYNWGFIKSQCVVTNFTNVNIKKKGLIKYTYRDHLLPHIQLQKGSWYLKQTLDASNIYSTDLTFRCLLTKS